MVTMRRGEGKKRCEVQRRGNKKPPIAYAMAVCAILYYKMLALLQNNFIGLATFIMY